MSTDNAGLSDYDTPEQRRRARSQTLRSIGAVYGRSRKKTEVDRSETDSECRNCGAPVSARFVAVFGDNDGRIFNCLDCSTYNKLVDGTAAGVDR